VAYGTDEKHTFDFFAPVSDEPTPLLIFIHGGGFTGGDKQTVYNDAGYIELMETMLSNRVAFATINYRLLENGETEGVLKPLNDSKRALQYIKYHSHAFNIDKERIVLMGSSAGAGTSLWIGVNDDLVDANGDDISQESTRVQGVVALATQSTYDVLEWHNTVFSEYASEGFGYDEMISMVGGETVLKFYGIQSLDELGSEAVTAQWAQLDMLNLMTSDDPDIYVNNNGPYQIPANEGAVLHHPLHAKAIFDHATSAGIGCVALVPNMEIDNTGGETMEGFVLRKLGK
jgi:hypothetical protein